MQVEIMYYRILLILSKGVSYFGSKLFSFSISWSILYTTGSGINFSGSLVVNYIPVVIFSFFTGVFNDKNINAKLVLIVCDLVSATVCLLPVVNDSLPSLYITIFILSSISAIFNNTIDSQLPQFYGIDSSIQLKQMVASLQCVVSITNIVAPAIGGALVYYFSIKVFAIINCISFLLSALGESRLRYHHHVVGSTIVPNAEKNNKNSVTLIHFLKNNRSVRTFLIGDALGNFFICAGVNVAFPFIITKTLGLSSLQYGIISSSVACGSIISSMVHIKFPPKTSMTYPFLSLSLIGFLLLLVQIVCKMDLTFVFAAFCIIRFLLGWLSVGINIRTRTAFQICVPADIRGRAMGAMTSISYILTPISTMLAGSWLEIYSATLLVSVCGILLLISMFFLSLYSSHTKGINGK